MDTRLLKLTTRDPQGRRVIVLRGPGIVRSHLRVPSPRHDGRLEPQRFLLAYDHFASGGDRETFTDYKVVKSPGASRGLKSFFDLRPALLSAFVDRGGECC